MQDHTMQHKKKMPAFRCLVIIIDSNIRDKLTEFLTDASIPIYYPVSYTHLTLPTKLEV